MKKTMVGAAAALALLVAGGCATPYPMGMVYTDVRLPGGAGEAKSATKVGEATCQTVLGMVAWGDASVTTAAKNGGVTNIKYVDFESRNVLGLFGTYRCIVYGD